MRPTADQVMLPAQTCRAIIKYQPGVLPTCRATTFRCRPEACCPGPVIPCGHLPVAIGGCCCPVQSAGRPSSRGFRRACGQASHVGIRSSERGVSAVEKTESSVDTPIDAPQTDIMELHGMIHQMMKGRGCDACASSATAVETSLRATFGR
ncbi:hypothetical protein OROGR_015094 [Orobanche gracilis]